MIRPGVRFDVIYEKAATSDLDNIKQRKQEDPDQVDEVPVQPRILDKHFMLRAELAAVGQQQNKHEHTD